MSYRDQSWEVRVAVLGDEAEAVFESVYPHGFVRFGLRRPPISVSKLPPMIRYTPDYLTSSGLIEVMGFGRDQTLKLKLEKETALHMWSQIMPTRFFIWDRTNRRYGYVDIQGMTATAHAHGALERLDEKRAWFIPADALEIEWATIESC